MSDNEIYLLIKHIKNVLWKVAKRLSYTEDARCLKVNLESENNKSILLGLLDPEDEDKTILLQVC